MELHRLDEDGDNESTPLNTTTNNDSVASSRRSNYNTTANNNARQNSVRQSRIARSNLRRESSFRQRKSHDSTSRNSGNNSWGFQESLFTGSFAPDEEEYATSPRLSSARKSHLLSRGFSKTSSRLLSVRENSNSSGEDVMIMSDGSMMMSSRSVISSPASKAAQGRRAGSILLYHEDHSLDDTNHTTGSESGMYVYRKRSLRRRLFLLLTEPDSSLGAAIVFSLLVIMITLSVMIMVIQTMDHWQYTPDSCHICGGTSTGYTADDDDIVDPIVAMDDATSCVCPPKHLPWTDYVQDRLMFIFAVEWILRTLSFAPPVAEENNGLAFLVQWLSFLTEWSQIVDALAVLPYYLERMDRSNTFLSLRLLRFARVFRVLRLGQYNDTFSSLVNVLTSAASSLNLLLIVVVFGAVVFGSLMYWLEKGKWMYTDLTDPPSYQFVRQGLDGTYDISPFTSIPACFWWFIVTSTTVGYGDTYPVTTGGKIVAAFAMLVGVLVIAFPVSVFSDLWALELEKSGGALLPGGNASDSSHTSTERLSVAEDNDDSEQRPKSLLPRQHSETLLEDMGKEFQQDNAPITPVAAFADGAVTLSREQLNDLQTHMNVIDKSRRQIDLILLSATRKRSDFSSKELV